MTAVSTGIGRPMIILSLLEKVGYVATVVVLYLERRLGPVQLITAGPDALLGLFFLAAFFKMGPSGRHPQPLISH